ncbi:MAG: rhodanese-like domain-containing protein, partial [Granulosicoccaceae bacterium]
LNVPDIEATEALALRGGLLVDVRTDDERALSMLPGAIDQMTYEALPKAERQNAIIYCTIGVRSGEYVAELAKEGIEASNLAGGLLSWTHAGGTMLHKGQAVDEAHVYGRRWNLLPKPYKAEWFWWVL